jgi:hypothetical protein
VLTGTLGVVPCLSISEKYGRPGRYQVSGCQKTGQDGGVTFTVFCGIPDLCSLVLSGTCTFLINAWLIKFSESEEEVIKVEKDLFQLRSVKFREALQTENYLQDPSRCGEMSEKVMTEATVNTTCWFRTPLCSPPPTFPLFFPLLLLLLVSHFLF